MGNYIGKIPFFSVFGAVNPHPWTDQGEIWQTVRSSLPNVTLIGATCRPCGAKNLKIGPWVNEIPAELPLGQILPVNKKDMAIANGTYVRQFLQSA